jgi:hypothetical protein
MLNQQQIQTLRTQLESSAYEALLQSSSTIPGLTAQVKSAVVHDDGAVTITFAMGILTLDSSGKITAANTAYVAPTPGQPNPNNPFGQTSWGVMTVNNSATTLVAAEAALSFLLAIFLLVTGILVLRQTPAGRKLLLAYALLKLAAGILGIVALAWMLRTITASDANNLGFASNIAKTFKGMGTAALILTCIGLIFPLAVLLILLSSKEVKDYYARA